MQNKKIAVQDPLGALVANRKTGDRIILTKNGDALFDLLITNISGKVVTLCMMSDPDVNIVIVPGSDGYKKSERN